MLVKTEKFLNIFCLKLKCVYTVYTTYLQGVENFRFISSKGTYWLEARQEREVREVLTDRLTLPEFVDKTFNNLYHSCIIPNQL